MPLTFIGALVACGPEYDHTTITNVKGSDIGGTMDLAHLEVPEGMITTANIVVYNDDDEIMKLVPRSADPSTIEVSNIINAHNYGFIGLKKGHTQILLYAEDELVVTIEADVTEQHPLP
jgi:hypothetical protein